VRFPVLGICPGGNDGADAAGSGGLAVGLAVGATQELAEAARAAAIEVLRYESVRDPHAGANLALLTCLAFAEPRPIERQTWRIRLSESGVHAICEFPDIRIGFDRNSFAADPRIAAIIWDR
jgi:RES domain-containing protein